VSYTQNRLPEKTKAELNAEGYGEEFGIVIVRFLFVMLISYIARSIIHDQWHYWYPYWTVTFLIYIAGITVSLWHE
jgi:hypothetical protein